MTARDASLVGWFLGLEGPVTTRDIANRYGYTERTARRKVRVLADAGLATPAGFLGDYFLWRPRAR